MLSEDETYSIGGPQCPFCGCQITADGPEYYDEQNYTEEDCPDCGETFVVSVSIQTSWSAYKPETPDA